MKTLRQSFILIMTLVITLSICSCGTKPYEAPIENYIKSIEKNDVDKLIAAMPKDVVDALSEATGEDEFKNTMSETLDQIVAGMEDEYGKDLEISYKIKDDKEVSKDDLKAKQKEVKENYGVDVEITEGYELTIESEFKGDKKKDTDKSSMTVYKINGEWSMLDIM